MNEIYGGFECDDPDCSCHEHFEVEQKKADIAKIKDLLCQISLAGQSSMSSANECGRLAREALKLLERKL